MSMTVLLSALEILQIDTKHVKKKCCSLADQQLSYIFPQFLIYSKVIFKSVTGPDECQGDLDYE